jgi:sugar phosphate permease
MMIVFVITLAKWYSRAQLALVFGLWFTNEAVAAACNLFVTADEYTYITSGILMVILSAFYPKYYTLDPNDCGLIINEQAINLTSQFANEVRE